MISGFILACLASGSFGSDAETPSARANAIYLDPLAPILSWALDTLPIPMSVTFERELAGGKSITFQPTLTLGNAKRSYSRNRIQAFRSTGTSGAIQSSETIDSDVFGVGVRVALRKYLSSSESRGFYLAPALGIAYRSESRETQQGIGFPIMTSGTKKAIALSGLGYLGYRCNWDRFTLYADGGVGGNIRFVLDSWNMDDELFDKLALDLNLGLGYSF